MPLNLDSLVVDSSGRASFSGLATGIDFVGTVDAIIAAKRIPAVTLETRITGNEEEIAALTDLRALMDSLKNAVSTLRGAVTVGGSGDIFNNNQVFASTSRTDGQTPAAAGSLMGVSVTSAAATGSHEIEIRRIATAHKISSTAFASQSDALAISGSFTITGASTDTTITVAATDSLLDIRERINNANTGTTPSGVTASIVTVTSTEHYLIITNDATGADLVITDSGTVLSSLGLSSTNGTAGFRNGLAASKVESADGFAHVAFDGSQSDNAFLISYDSATKLLTLTRGDGATDTVTLSSTAIATGKIETASFDSFGVSIVLNENFDKSTDITVAADTASITLGTGAIDAATIKITDSTGDVSGIASTTLTFGSLATPAAITITAGAFSGTFDGTSTGLKTVTLSDGGGNSLDIEFNVTATFDGTETAASIELHELENLVMSSGNPFANVLQKAQTARLTADGLVDADRFESNVITSKTGDLADVISVTNATGSFLVDATSVSYDASVDSLQDIADRITSTVANVTATVVEDGAGFRMDITTTNASLTVTDTTGLLGNLGVDNDLVIERSGNTISDIFAGVTLSLFQSEPDTKIKIDIEQDLAAVKSAIVGLVDAYNAVRVLINTENQVDPATGLKGDESGVLFGSRIMNDVRSQLANIVGLGATGVSIDFSVLAQIGVDLVNNAEQSSELDFNTLGIDDTKLDTALLGNIDDVRRLFTFEFSSSDPNVSLISFTGNTSFNTSGYTLNIGTIGNFDQNSAIVVDKTATLDDASSTGATTSGTFDINGFAVAYDVTTDTLETLATAINDAAISGVTAIVVDDTTGAHIAVNSSIDPLVIDNDTGDLLTKMSFTPDANIIDSANINGAADGSGDGTVSISGRALTVSLQSGAEGLQVFYSGAASTSGIQLDFTIGVGAQTYFTLDGFLDKTNGAIQGEIATLEGQNITAQDRIDGIDRRLAILRESMTARFIAAEQALARMETLLESIRQTFEVLANRR